MGIGGSHALVNRSGQDWIPVYTVCMNPYETQYKALQFERAGLFKAVQEKYQSKDVLYPGSSVHITPSLYFPHVVYVDQSEAAAKFFADERFIAEFVSRNKLYKQSAYVRFIQQDYSTPLPVVEDKFDLVLALFAGGVASSCVRYLKIGGRLLTNNHQHDAMDAVRQDGLKLTAQIRFQKHAYIISEEDLDEDQIPAQKPDNKYLKQASQGVMYVEQETYYLFQRVR
jgi:hypothetical protein